MRIVVVGGSGHIGSFLVPRLVRAGHEVVNLSRGTSAPYVEDAAWDRVEQVTVDRAAEDAAGTFGDRVVALQPEVVVDLVCFTPRVGVGLVEALRGHVGHLVHCGSIWRHGPSVRVPVSEDDPTPPLGDYGIGKAAVVRLLEQETAAGGLVTTSLHPGHISGPGWPAIGPLGNLDPGVWWALSAGEEVLVPGLGAELMHHVHADDVAQAFSLAVEHRDAAAGQAFSVVASSALTARGFLGLAAGWFGQEARTRSVGWEEFRGATAPDFAEQSWEHLSRSHYASIDKARNLLGFAPAYAPEEAVLEAVRWLIDHDRLPVARPLVA